MNTIKWPKDYEKGKSDNFVASEIITDGLKAEEAWKYLVNTKSWLKYYYNLSHVVFHNGQEPNLYIGLNFSYIRYDYKVNAEVVEFEAPIDGNPGRIAWHGRAEGAEESTLDFYHAWLFENLLDGRVRLLTEESMNGEPAIVMAATTPNPLQSANQDWLEKLVNAAKEKQTLGYKDYF